MLLPLHVQYLHPNGVGSRDTILNTILNTHFLPSDYNSFKGSDEGWHGIY